MARRHSMARRKVTLSCERFGCYGVTGRDVDEFYQTDWDFPALARRFGWNGKVGRERCTHDSTDGTVDCKACGKTASQFIAAATDYLDRNDGKTIIEDGF